LTYLIFALGLTALFFGGDILIKGAVGLAHRFHVPPLIIGATIVGFGTSTPELLVSLQAALAGSPALALGNVIGSNIANILLILGVAAVIVAVPLPAAAAARDFAFMIGATVLLWVMLGGGAITRPEGLMLLAGLAVYLWLSLRAARAAPPPEEAIACRPLWQSLCLALAGLVLLMVGARFLVDSATEIARALGVSEAVIGLTIVAVGTSLPELAASILAALRRHPELAVGNILGSNVFNILGILGITAAVAPVPVDARFSVFDIALALAAALAMAAFAVTTGRMGRVGGAGLLAVYGGYIAMLGLG